MGTTAIISPQIIDSTVIGRNLITSVDSAAGRSVLEMEDSSYNWTAAHVFEGSIESSAYNFTANQDGQLNQPTLANSIYMRFNNSDVYRFNALDFWPVANGTKNLGRSDHEWANVYSVAGAFSGTVTANAFVGDGSGLTNLPGGNPFDQDLNTTDSPSFVDGSFSGQLDVESGGSQKYYNLGQEGDTDTEYLEQTWTGNVCKYRALATGAGSVRRIDFEGSGIRFTAAGIAVAEIASGDLRLYSGRTIRPLLDNDASVGKTGQRFTNVYSYDGSFSGNLNVEVGGTQRVYGLGTEGDTDSHYLQSDWDGTFYRIGAKATGAGGNKSTMLDFGGSSRILVTSGEIRVYRYLRPSDTTIDIGRDANRFRTGYFSNVDSVDGDFSGDVVMAANVDFTGLPTADPVVAGRLWNDSGTLKISAG